MTVSPCSKDMTKQHVHVLVHAYKTYLIVHKVKTNNEMFARIACCFIGCVIAMTLPRYLIHFSQLPLKFLIKTFGK